MSGLRCWPTHSEKCLLHERMFAIDDFQFTGGRETCIRETRQE